MRGRKYENVICFTFQPLKFWSTPSPLQGYSLIPRSDAKRGEDTKRWLAWYGLKSLPTDGAFAYPPIVVSCLLLTYMFFYIQYIYISLEQRPCPQSLGIGPDNTSSRFFTKNKHQKKSATTWGTPRASINQNKLSHRPATWKRGLCRVSTVVVLKRVGIRGSKSGNSPRDDWESHHT